MEAADIQCALKKKKITQKALAEQIGVSPITVSNVIIGDRISDRVMRAVAVAIGEDYRKVFDWYYLQPPKRRTSKTASL